MEEAGLVEIQVNGEPRDVPGGQRLLELITSFGLAPATVLVEHNGQALLRGEWEAVQLGKGDRLEILRVAAGG